MKLNDREKILYEDSKMDEDERTHFGMYHGSGAYMPINDNDLWDLECGFLRELMYAIRTMMKNHRIGITDDYFRWNPKEYYIERFELKSFTEEGLLKLWEAIEKLIEFKERLKVGWPYLQF